MSRAGRPPVAFIAWTPLPGRGKDLARALGGESRTFHAFGIVSRRAIGLRYAVDALRTLLYIAWRRPRAVIAVNPPPFAALIALAYGRLARAPLVLDSHPSAFGLAGDVLSQRLLRVHRFVARRAVTTLVTAESLAEQVRSWGARADVLHEAPPAFELPPRAPRSERPRVLFAGVFSRDEPVEELVEAARLVPEVELAVTGERRLAPPGLIESAPPNVTFTGFLHGDDYVRALADADALIALSTEPTSVMRTAYEAVFSFRPLIVSDWPNLRDVFPDALHVANDSEAIAAAFRSLPAELPRLAERAAAARERQERRVEEQLAVLRELIGHSIGP